jgi:hypothetical protein
MQSVCVTTTLSTVLCRYFIFFDLAIIITEGEFREGEVGALFLLHIKNSCCLCVCDLSHKLKKYIF